MAAEWRILQVFLSPRQPAIYEVELNLDTQETRCTCPTFKGRNTCRHNKFVRARMDGNDGNYPLMVHEKAETENIDDIMSTPDKFREFVIQYGRIEVL